MDDDAVLGDVGIVVEIDEGIADGGGEEGGYKGKEEDGEERRLEGEAAEFHGGGDCSMKTEGGEKNRCPWNGAGGNLA